MAQLMPLPLIVSCFSKIQIGFTFMAPAHSGSPGQRAVIRVCEIWIETVQLNSFSLVDYFLYLLTKSCLPEGVWRRYAAAVDGADA